MSKRAVNCFLLLFVGNALFYSASFALDPNKRITQYDIRIYKAKDGLPMNSLKKIFQDSKGYIWLGTQEGLVRFDGVQFKLYDKSKYPGLKSNFIWDIAEDKEGNLWLATNGGGISRFNGQSFASYDTSNGLSHNVTRKLLIDSQNTIWIGTETGVCCLRQGFIKSLRNDNLPGKFSVQAIFESSDGSIYFGGAGGYWAIHQKDTLIAQLLSFDPAAIFQTRAGELLVAGSFAQIFHFKDGTFKKLSYDSKTTALRSDHHVRSIIEDRDGGIWFCTEGLGILRYYKGHFDTLSVKTKLKFDNNFFLSGMEDKEGNLWFGGECGLIQIKYVYASLSRLIFMKNEQIKQKKPRPSGAFLFLYPYNSSFPLS